MRPVLVPSPQVEVVPSVQDQCDGCGAAARLGLRLANGGELTFCGHHANRHADRIVRTARLIILEDGFDWTGASQLTR
ncbi:hypothetical protein [Micromonospora sp. NPDC049679]|uniref:DUF7455 domain-containing protein n=1 Tax=Micromonospora sp. NPDC049679 TaxID=3155920 RepID=UPI0033C5D0E2